MKVNGKDDNPYIMENNKCSKPPTRFYLVVSLVSSPLGKHSFNLGFEHRPRYGWKKPSEHVRKLQTTVGVQDFHWIRRVNSFRLVQHCLGDNNRTMMSGFMIQLHTSEMGHTALQAVEMHAINMNKIGMIYKYSLHACNNVPVQSIL